MNRHKSIKTGTSQPRKPMALVKRTSQLTDEEYKEGVPREHRRLHILGGDTVLQVNNALFRVHRHFLAKHSSILEDTLSLPPSVSNTASNTGVAADGYIQLSGDSVVGWEYLLSLFYPEDPCQPIVYNAEQWASIVLLANKYVMEGIEESAMKQLRKATPKLDMVDLMVLAQKVGSDELYKEALHSLAQQSGILSLEEAQKIGLSTFHDVLMTRQEYFEWRKKPKRRDVTFTSLLFNDDSDN